MNSPLAVARGDIVIMTLWEVPDLKIFRLNNRWYQKIRRDVAQEYAIKNKTKRWAWYPIGRLNENLKVGYLNV